MPNITFTFNPEQLIGALDDVAKTQVPFALSQAINDAALAFQAKQRETLKERMVIRVAFVLQQIKIVHFAKKAVDQLYALITIDPRADYLNKFEEGDPKIPRGAHLAIPVEAKPNVEDIVKQELRPKALELEENDRGQFKGLQRTFLINADKSGNPAIFQRTGSGKNDIQLLWAMRQQARTPRLLSWRENADAVIPQEVARSFPLRLKAAIANPKVAKSGDGAPNEDTGFRFR